MRRGSLTTQRPAFSMDGDGTPDALLRSQPGVCESPGRVVGDPFLGGGFWGGGRHGQPRKG
jgi:hypothetical protein